MRLIDIILALCAHLLIGAAVLLATLAPESPPAPHRVTGRIDMPLRQTTAMPSSGPEASAPADPRFMVRVHPVGNRLQISGEVFGGPPCQRMQLQLKLQPETGAGPALYHTLIVSDTGAQRNVPFHTERRIDGSDAKTAADWAATVQSHRCVPSPEETPADGGPNPP